VLTGNQGKKRAREQQKSGKAVQLLEETEQVTNEPERKHISQSCKKAREGRKGLAVGAGPSSIPDLPGLGDDTAICT